MRQLVYFKMGWKTGLGWRNTCTTNTLATRNKLRKIVRRFRCIGVIIFVKVFRRDVVTAGIVVLLGVVLLGVVHIHPAFILILFLIILFILILFILPGRIIVIFLNTTPKWISINFVVPVEFWGRFGFVLKG
jgi:hypothetical protein